MGKLSPCVTSHLGQLSLPFLQGRLIEYQPVWLGLCWDVFTLFFVAGCKHGDPIWLMMPHSSEMTCSG